MRKNFMIFLVVVLFPMMAWAGQNFGTVFDAAVYKSPNANSELITTLEVGSEINVVAFDHDNYWAKVSLPNGQTGYVDLGCLDYPGGQTVTVTETFDANKVASKEAQQSNVGKIIVSIVFFLLVAAGLGHMVYIRANKDNEPRIFVGSMGRLVLFGALMAVSVFMADGFWDALLRLLCAVLFVAFSYYAYLRPQSKLLVEGALSRNLLQMLGGMWTDLENQKVDKAKIGMMQEKIEELRFRKSGCSSQGESDMLKSQISSLENEIHVEESKAADTAVVLTFVSVGLGLVFIWITPFVAILQYARNYPLYLRKRNKYQRQAAEIGYVE